VDPKMTDFFPIKKTGTKKTQILLRMDEYDFERLEELEPYTVTVQEKLRQIVKMFLDGGLDEEATKVVDDLDGL
jgi:predicted DNA-binding protein (UPF0251 family)